MRTLVGDERQHSVRATERECEQIAKKKKKKITELNVYEKKFASFVMWFLLFDI